ncbi:hypothetical protein [Streptomyces sp. NPDC059076]|uniref:hypothetical protein n=1 Tax=unclassified Streptomyces TaxID=2593676 RepID=UPI0036C7453A
MGLGNQHQKTNVRSWHFILHTDEPLTPEQDDTLAGLDSLNDGRIGLEDVRGVESTFVCYFEANQLTDAVAEAPALFDDLPGVRIRSVELSPPSLDHNGMAMASVVPAPF